MMFARNEKRSFARPRTATRPALPQASALANEFTCFVRARCQQQRRFQQRLEMDRAHFACASPVQPKIAVEGNIDQRLEIEHAADRDTADDCIGDVPRAVQSVANIIAVRCPLPSVRRRPDALRRHAVVFALARQPLDGLPDIVPQSR